MRKTDKKIDNQIRETLTDVCETTLKTIEGFQWLTHTVNYSNFPNSLRVVCVFDSNENLNFYLSSDNKNYLPSFIKQELLKINIKLKSIKKHVFFDTEENCDKQDDGNWAKRLS